MKSKHFYTAVIVFLLIQFASLFASAQSKFFIKMAGQKQGQIKGCVTEKGKEGKIEGIDFNVTGGTAVLETKNDNTAFPLLQKALVSNEMMNNVVLEYYKPSDAGPEELYRTVNINNARILNLSKNTHSTKITLKFEKIERTLVDKN